MAAASIHPSNTETSETVGNSTFAWSLSKSASGLGGSESVVSRAGQSVKPICGLPDSHKLFRNGVSVVKISASGTKKHRQLLAIKQSRYGTFIILSKTSSLPLGKPELQLVIDIGSIGQVQRGGKQFSQNVPSIPHSRSNASHSGQASVSSTDSKKTVPIFDPDRCFSIFYRDASVLHLIARSFQDREEIIWAIKTHKFSNKNATDDVQLLRHIWLAVDKDNSNTIDFKELGHIMDKINISLTKQELSAQFKELKIGDDHLKEADKKALTFDQTVGFLLSLKRDMWQFKPSNKIWSDLFGKDSRRVSAEKFLERFLHKTQGETEATIEYVHKLFAALNQMDVASAAPDNPPDTIDIYRFEVYLTSRTNDVFRPERETFTPSTMFEPLSHYFINSSHATYLNGDQNQSQSSVKLYTRALYRGSRYVEVKVVDHVNVAFNDTKSSWENEPIPVVSTGQIMDSVITFRDVVNAIYEFIRSNPETYPIILSIENHCTIPSQQVMAASLIDILGDKLYVPDESGLSGDLPSPASLKGKVVIKGNRSANAGAQPNQSGDQDEKHKKASAVVAPELAKITLLHSTRFNRWEVSSRKPSHHMHSFGDAQVKKIFKQRQNERCIVHNQSHLTLTHPSKRPGSNTSVNYNPILAWSMGCQLASLHTHTRDYNLFVNDGFFRQNGDCGYVLKSRDWLHDSVRALDSEEPATLNVRILSGSCLPRVRNGGKCANPYVKLTLYDVDPLEKEEVIESYVTDTVPGNGYFPVWNDDFEFLVKNSGMAVILLTVHDMMDGKDRDGFIAHAAIPVLCLRKGFRSVRLFDANNTRRGAFDFASLLIEVQWKSILQEQDLKQFDTFESLYEC